MPLRCPGMAFAVHWVLSFKCLFLRLRSPAFHQIRSILMQPNHPREQTLSSSLLRRTMFMVIITPENDTLLSSSPERRVHYCPLHPREQLNIHRHPHPIEQYIIVIVTRENTVLLSFSSHRRYSIVIFAPENDILPSPSRHRTRHFRHFYSREQ